MANARKKPESTPETNFEHDPNAALREKVEAAKQAVERMHEVDRICSEVVRSRGLSEDEKLEKLMVEFTKLGYDRDTVDYLATRKRSSNPNSNKEYFGFTWSDKEGIKAALKRAEINLKIATGGVEKTSFTQAEQDRPHDQGPTL
jgi:hypothetical protein